MRWFLSWTLAAVTAAAASSVLATTLWVRWSRGTGTA
ncbi:WISP1 isoform 2 [Pongo abelii]|uniref:WISP1 isoform 2 n=1 Tax=Pongo abelii TaxID=9601 RepID=A0A2J8RKT4_PONAB|nr:WISP1 isoform 2 [Pongo abelii]